MATVTRRGGSYWCRWKELVVSMTDAGETVRAWKDRSRTFPSKESANRFAAELEVMAARGERFTDKREEVIATIKQVHDAYCAACQNDRTRKWRKSMIGTFVTWAGADRPVSDLSPALLTRYADQLPNVGREQSTRHRKVLGVEGMWAWAYDPRQRGRFPGVPEPVKVTGTDVDAPVQAPAAVVRLAAPTVADVDAMIGQLRKGWKHGTAHRRVALLCRYTGIRISQAVNLLWRDVRLDYTVTSTDDKGKVTISPCPHLVIRAKTRGAKKSKTRVVPLHAALAAEMRDWSLVREGRVFEGTNERWTRGEATREAMRTAWTAAGVDPAKWDVPDLGEDEEGERGHGTPTHAVRAAVLNHLLRRGVVLTTAQYLIGHATSSTTAAYVPETAPETSPMWDQLVAGAAQIPAHAT